MPDYNTQNPANSIYPGDVALAFNAEAPAAGEARAVTGVRGNFIRAIVNAISGGSGVTAQILG